MAQADILSERDRVELIDGEVVAMTPIGPPAAGLLGRVGQVGQPRCRKNCSLLFLPRSISSKDCSAHGVLTALENPR